MVDYVLKAETGHFKIDGNSLRFTVQTKLPEEHGAYSLIGRVASEWAHFEHVLDLTIWELVGAEAAKVSSLTAQMMGAYPRIKAIISLLRTRTGNITDEHHLGNDELIKKYTSLMGRTNDPSDARARLVHDAWYMQQDTSEPTQFRAMPWRNPQHGFEAVNLEAVGKLIEQIHNLTAQAAELKERALNALEASRERIPRPRPELWTQSRQSPETDKT